MDQATRNLPSQRIPATAPVESAARRVIAVEAAVRAALRSCGRRPIAELHCDCFLSGDDQVMVTLSGHLSSFYLSQLAQELVRHVPGVHQVRNRVQVEFQRS